MVDIQWQQVWKKKFFRWKHSLNSLPQHQSASWRMVRGFSSNIREKPWALVRGGSPLSPKRKLNFPKIFATLSFLIFLTFFLGSLTGVIFLIILARDLPRPDRIVRREGFATKIFDRNGKLIYDVFEKEKRTPVQLYEVPQYLKDATVSIEDKDFYTHKGFDPKGYLRVIYYLIVRHRLQGGSTLTQQLVKNVLLSSERTVKRKIKEFILALEIESQYSKDQILQMYLNESPYGGTCWGVEEASQTYFGKTVSQLSLIESAVLAGLPQRPSYYSPLGNTPTAFIERTKDVLRRMREDGRISLDQEKKALNELESVKFASKSGTLKAPHFVMYVKRELEEKYGEKVVELGGLRVTTSLDLDFQEKVQKIVSEEIAKVENLNITNGSTIVLNPKTGEILAMVGSKNYDDPNYDGKFNVVTAKRQPGSAIKPVTYVTALKKGYTAATLIMDTSTAFPVTGKPDYTPVNYDEKEHGPLQVRFALGNSINIATVKMLAKIGLKEMLSTAFEMGLTTLEPTKENLSRLGLSVTLGGGEVRLIDLATAYSAFANGGLKVEPISILKITDKDGNFLEEFKPLPGKRILRESEAFIISHILSDNSARLLTFSENSLLNVSNRQIAVKTGTTNDKKDNWTIGWTPQVIVGVWVGNNNNSSMKKIVSGVSGAAPIWRRIILSDLEGKENLEFAVPAEIVSAEVDKISGFRAHDDFPSRTEYFIQGTEPADSTVGDPVHLKIKICKNQKKLATPVDIARGDYEEKEFFIFKEDDPFFSEGQINRWQKGIDEYVAKQPDERYHPPTEYCNTLDQIYIKFISPQDQTQVSSNFTVKVEPVSANDIVKVEIFVDGVLKKELTSIPYELEMTLPEGKYTIRAVAHDSQGNEGIQESRIGVNIPWDWNPTPTPPPLPSPTVTPSITLTPTPTSSLP